MIKTKRAFVFALPLVGVFLFLGFTGMMVYSEPYVCEDCNVLLIVIDTLRADHVSSYGYFEETTPVIDRLASEGILFENAFSQIPLTPPSVWSIMSGVYPFKHQRFTPDYVEGGLTGLGTLLRENGYETAGFVSSYMLRGLIDEFDTFAVPHGIIESDSDNLQKVKSPAPADVTTERALDWLDDSDGKFFLMIHYFDLHSPYEPPEGFDVFNYTDEPAYSDARYDAPGVLGRTTIREDVARYDGELRFADHNVGIVLERLDELNLSGRTLVVLVSDHGECFGEHNFSDFGYDMERPCVFHGKTLYEEEIHVPLIIRNPNSTIRGRVPDVVENIDVMPTVLDIIGIEIPDVDGRSLTGVIEGKPSSWTAVSQIKPFSSGLFSVGIRTNEWKLVRMISGDVNLEDEIAEQGGGGKSGSGESGGESTLLFNLVSDPHEISNLFGQRPEAAESLESLLYEKVSGIRYQGETVVIDKETEDILRSLGYIE